MVVYNMSFQPIPRDELLSTDYLRYMLSYSRACAFPEPNGESGHIHDCYEIYLNISGDVSFLVNNRVYTVDKGTVIFTRPHDIHVCIYPKECMHEHFCMWIIDPEHKVLDFAHKPDFEPFIVLSHDKRERLMELFFKLKEEQTTKLNKTAAFFEILSLLQNGERDVGQSTPTQLPVEMQQILTYINLNFRELNHVQDVYDRFYISPATLTRWFRKYTGLSPHVFLESKKLAYAKHLLNKGCTVTQAAEEAGFSDCSRFISVFKKKFGITPKVYKQQRK